ncbi:SIMPL domain-containing protein [Devosia sp. Root105]|uniref:SIMPL domain-containing protein n=1 Tax=Devosia sp. Root105 TaxID=1736423 RepID=UPI000B298428|nr:SIMPL domain-containing protein [Devosia sp. Root105]
MKLYRSALVLALALLPTCAFAQDPTIVRQEIDRRPYIYIEASGRIETAADLTKIAISLSEKRKSPEEATKLISDKIAQLRAALTQLGIADSSVETKSFQFAKVYLIAKDKKGEPVSSFADPDRDKFDGFRATYDAVATLATTDRIGEVLSSASALGIEVDSVTFASSREAEYVEQVRKIAADKARSRAEVYAQSLGGTLGDLLNVKEGTGYNPDTMAHTALEGYADLAVLDPSTAPMAIAPGKLTYEASVSAKWALAPAK